MSTRKRKKRLFVQTIFPKKPTVKNVQAQVKNIRKRLKKEPFISVKSDVSGTLDETPVVAHIDLYSTGAGSNGVVMEGMTATLKSVRIKGWFKSVGVTNVPGRLDIVLDRTPVAGTLATFNEIYLPASGAATSVNSMMKPAGKARFKLLASFRGSALTNDGQVFMFERYIRMNHKIASITAQSYTQATQIKNAILIVHWADANANQPTYQYVTQVVLMDDN